jgi:hypothetical protein
MAAVDDDPSTSGARDPHALYEEYQQSNDPTRKRYLLAEIHTCYCTDARMYRDDEHRIIWLLLRDTLTLVASCCSIEAAKRLLLEHAHNGGFLRYSWHQSEESLRGPNPQHRGIGPGFWGVSRGSVHYPVDWENSSVAYVRFAVSPYSPEGAVLEKLAEAGVLPVEPYSRIDLVRLPLHDVLMMLHRAGLLPDASRSTPSSAPISAPPAASPESLSAATSAAAPKIPRNEWLDRYLTQECQRDLATRHNEISSVAREINKTMSDDPTVEAYARARNIERHPIVRKLFARRPPKKKD